MSREARTTTRDYEEDRRWYCTRIGTEMAREALAGRRGHGGGPCLRRVLRFEELADLLERAARLGAAAAERQAAGQPTGLER